MGRTEKSIKNIIYGVFAQIVTTVIGFVSKDLLLNTLGIEAVSLNSLFHEIIAVLSLAELGLGSVIIYNLYKPLAENDEEKVCQLMDFYKMTYRVIALVLLCGGAIISIFAPLLVHDLSFSHGYERLVFMLMVIATSSSYLFSYKISLLNADQKEYVYSIYSSILNVVTFLVKVAVLFLTHNFVAYLSVCIVLTLITNYVISLQVDKLFPYLHKAKLPKEDKKNIFGDCKNIFVKQVSGKITSSTDNMIISAMVSTIMVGKYSFYATITGMLMAFTEKIESGTKAGLGNQFATATPEECEKTVYRLTWLHNVLGIVFSTCFFLCSQSFISWWVGEENLLEISVVAMLSVNLYCYIACKPIYAAMSVSGLFKDGKNISITGSLINLVISIVFAYFTGIFGIFLGTFCTYFVQIVLKTHCMYKKVFKKPEIKYHLYMLKDGIILFALMAVGYYICGFINSSAHFIDFLLKGCTGFALSAVTILLVYWKSQYFAYFKDLAFKVIKRKK